MKKNLPVLRAMAAMLTVTLLAACQQTAAPGSAAAPAATAAASAETAAPAAESAAPDAPAETGENAEVPTLTYWMELSPGKVSDVVSYIGDTPLYQKIMEETGVNIEFLHPPSGQTKEQFNLMIASMDLPDIMEASLGWDDDYPGGPAKAAQDGVIIPLTPYVFESDAAPNFRALLERDKEIAQTATSDSGDVYAFPFVREDLRQCVVFGPQVRQDLLDQLDMEIPTTIAEWETMLLTFKNELNIEVPYTFVYQRESWNSSMFCGAWGVASWFYRDAPDHISFGPAEPAFKEYLTVMNSWYSQGLIDPDFMSSTDSKLMDALITSKKSGAWLGLLAGNMGSYINVMKDDPEFKVVGVPYPSLEEGGEVHLSNLSPRLVQNTAAITTSCENVEAAVRLLDYGYGEEGQLLMNFGIEGESFEYIDGVPTYLESISKPETGTMSNAMSFYSRTQYSAPFIQDLQAQTQFTETYPEQTTAKDAWFQAADANTVFPKLSYTEEQFQQYSSALNEVKPYQEEMLYKFITGQESLDNFDQYVEQLNTLGLQTMLDINNEALSRYLAR